MPEWLPAEMFSSSASYLEKQKNKTYPIFIFHSRLPLKGESSGHTCCIYIAPKVVKMNRRDFLPSSAQAKLIQAGLRLALISSLAGRPAWKSFFLLLPDLLGSWNFACKHNFTQLTLKWKEKASLPELPWLAILLLLAISQPFQAGFWWDKRENWSTHFVQSN